MTINHQAELVHAGAKNRRRDLHNKARMKVYGGATITGGDILSEGMVYGVSVGVNASGGEGFIRGEWCLAPGDIYAVRITNMVSPAEEISVSVNMQFYEDKIIWP